MAENENLILDEEIDEDYEPTEKEIEEYGEWLGMDKEKDKDLFWIAKEGLKAPLPKPWKPCQTAEGEIFYFNFRTGESVWDHPCDEHYRKVYEEEKKKREKEEVTKQKKKDKRDKKDKKEPKEPKVVLQNSLTTPASKAAELERPLSALSTSAAAASSAVLPSKNLFGKKPLTFLKTSKEDLPLILSGQASPTGVGEGRTPREPKVASEGNSDEKFKELEEKLKKEFAEKSAAAERNAKIELEICVAAAETKTRKQVDELKDANEDLQNRVAELQTKLEEQELENTKAESECTRLKSINEDKDAEIKAVRKRLDSAESEIRKTQAEKWTGSSAADKNTELVKEIEKLKEIARTKDEDWKNRVADLQKRLETQELKKTEVESDYKGLKLTMDNKDAEMNALRKRLETAESDARKTQMEKWTGSSAANNSEELQKEIAQLKERLRKKKEPEEEETPTVECERTMDATALAQARKILRLQEENENLTEENEKLKADKNEELSQIRTEIALEKKKASELQDENKSMEKEVKTLREEAKKKILMDKGSSGETKELRQKVQQFDGERSLWQCEIRTLKRRIEELENDDKSKNPCANCDGLRKKEDALEKKVRDLETQLYAHVEAISNWEEKGGELRREIESMQANAQLEVESARKDGYKEGQEKCERDFEQEKQDTFDEGYKKGAKEARWAAEEAKAAGIVEGYAKAETTSKLRDDSFQRGKEAGIAEGYANAQREAMRESNEDFEKGKRVGIVEGHAAGKAEAARTLNDNLDARKDAGFAEGYAKAKAEELRTGDESFERGKKIGNDEGYARGSDDARREAHAQHEAALKQHEDSLAQAKKSALSEAKDAVRAEIQSEVYAEAKCALRDEIQRDAADKLKRELANAKREAYADAKRDSYEDAKRDIYRQAKLDAYEEAKRDVYRDARRDAYDEAYSKARREAEDNVDVRVKEEAKRAIYDSTKQEALQDAKRESELTNDRIKLAAERDAEMKIWRVEEEWRQKIRDAIEEEQKTRVQLGETLRHCNERAFQLEADGRRTKNELLLQTDQVRALEKMTESLRSEVRRAQQNTSEYERQLAQLRVNVRAKEDEIADLIQSKSDETRSEEFTLKRKMRDVELQDKRLEGREKQCVAHERFLEEEQRFHDARVKELNAEEERIRARELAVRELEHGLKQCSAEMKQHLANPTFAADLQQDLLSLRTSVRQMSARGQSGIRSMPTEEVDEEREPTTDPDQSTKEQQKQQQQQHRSSTAEWGCATNLREGPVLDKAKKCLRVQQESLKRARSILMQNQAKWCHDASQGGLSTGCQKVLRAVKKVLDAQTERLNEDLRDVRAVEQFLDSKRSTLSASDDADQHNRASNAWAVKVDPVLSRISSLIQDASVPDDTVARYFPHTSINSLSDVNVSMVDRWRGVLFSPQGGRYAKAGLVSPRKESLNEPQASLQSAVTMYAIQRDNLRDVLRRHAGKMRGFARELENADYGGVHNPRTSLRPSTARPHYVGIEKR